jgi:hypothetical protein
VKLKGEDELWARVPHMEKIKNVHINLCPEAFNM